MDDPFSVVSLALAILTFIASSLVYIWIQSYNRNLEGAEAHVRRCGDIIVDSRVHPLTTEKIAVKANYSHLANSLQVELHAVDTPNPLIPYTKITAINKVTVTSKDKKEKDSKQGITPSAEIIPSTTAKTLEKTGEEKKDAFTKPDNQRAKVAVNDPQYHTLANLDNADAFGNDKKSEKNQKSPKSQTTATDTKKKDDKPLEKKPEPPEEEQKYQTLAAVEANDKKDQLEKAAAAEAKAKGTFNAPQVVKKAESNDPQYQTLVNLDNADAFGPQKPVFKAPTKVSKAEAKDPQYQTLAGLDDNLFKEEEKGGEGKKKEEKKEEKKEKEEKKKKSEKEKKEEKAKDSKEGSKEGKKESIDNIGDDIFKKDRTEVKSEIKDAKGPASKKGKKSESKKSKREGASKKSKRAT